MNYEGYVSSVDSSLCTFQLDNQITVHWAHLALRDSHAKVPVVGEHVQILKSHYKASDSGALDRLFLCEKSQVKCKHEKTYSTDNNLLKLVKKWNFGVSDLLEITNNVAVIEEFISSLIHESSKEALFEVIEVLLSNEWKCEATDNAHKCLNKVISEFNLKSISSCCYTTQATTSKCPMWSFGTYSKDNTCDILIGHLQINKRFGLILIYDNKSQLPCLITSKTKLSKKDILNKFVLVKQYRVFTESYRESNVPDLQYILFDVSDVIVLNLHACNVNKGDILVKELPEDFPFVYDFEFRLIKKGSVSINLQETIECWLEVLITSDSTCKMYLGLNAYQVRVVPFLTEGETYHVYHSEKLSEAKNIELHRLNNIAIKKFVEQNALFVYCKRVEEQILDVIEAKSKMLHLNDLVSVQGIINVKKLVPAITSRTSTYQKRPGFGTPGSYTHNLLLVDDSKENNLQLYLNNWENLQIPLGLVPNMRVCVRNVMPQKQTYLKCTALTTFEVLSYEPPVLFDTPILNDLVAQNKSSFLGLGDLLPCNILIWATALQIHIRSVKIESQAKHSANLEEGSDCGINTTMTLFVYDEMGQSLVISKSVELLRLLLGLELQQWKVWCLGFEKVKQFVYDKERKTLFSNDSDVNAFCEALSLTVQVVNTTKLMNLDLLCRKMESKLADNDGMPVWYCIDARKNNYFV